MLRQALITVAMILLPYLVYAIAEGIRRRRAERDEVVQSGFWQRAPVFALGLVGCLLAVTTLIAVAIIDNDPGQTRYSPPIFEDTE